MTVFQGESLTGFDGIPFRILWDGGDAATMPAWERESIVVTNHIPGSNATEIDLMGLGDWQRSFTVECADKYDFWNLRNKLQTEGVLTVPAAMNDLVDTDVQEVQAGTTQLFALISNVLFVSLTNQFIQVNGVCFGTATFRKETVDG